jgi:hypothetical protein
MSTVAAGPQRVQWAGGGGDDPSPSTVGLVINATAPTKVDAPTSDRRAAPCAGPTDADGRSACWKLSFALAGGQSATAVLTVTPARALALTAYSSDGSVATASLGTTTLASWWADWWSGGVLPVVEARLSIVVLGLIRLLAFSGWPSTVARAAHDVFAAGATSTVALVTWGATVILLALAGGGVGLWLRAAKQRVGGSFFPALYRERYLRGSCWPDCSGRGSLSPCGRGRRPLTRRSTRRPRSCSAPPWCRSAPCSSPGRPRSCRSSASMPSPRPSPVRTSDSGYRWPCAASDRPAVAAGSR